MVLFCPTIVEFVGQVMKELLRDLAAQPATGLQPADAPHREPVAISAPARWLPRVLRPSCPVIVLPAARQLRTV